MSPMDSLNPPSVPPLDYDSQLTDLQNQLDEGLTSVLDDLAAALNANAADAYGKLQIVTDALRGELKSLAGQIDPALTSIVDTVLMELQTAGTVNQTLLDMIVEQLGPLWQGKLPPGAPCDPRDPFGACFVPLQPGGQEKQPQIVPPLQQPGFHFIGGLLPGSGQFAGNLPGVGGGGIVPPIGVQPGGGGGGGLQNGGLGPAQVGIKPPGGGGGWIPPGGGGGEVQPIQPGGGGGGKLPPGGGGGEVQPIQPGGGGSVPIIPPIGVELGPVHPVGGGGPIIPPIGVQPGGGGGINPPPPPIHVHTPVGGPVTVNVNVAPCEPVINVAPCLAPCEPPKDIDLGPEGSGARGTDTVPLQAAPHNLQVEAGGGERERQKAVACALGNMARIGSEGWCASLDATLGKIRDMGKMILDVIGKTENAIFNFGVDAPDRVNTQAADIPEPFKTVFLAIFAMPAETIRFFAEQLQLYWGVAGCMMRAVTCDDLEITLSLIALRSTIKAFKNARVGLNIPFWATITISIEWDQAEAALDYMIKYSCPYIIPTVADAMHAYRRRYISTEVYECWLQMNGVDPGVWAKVYEAGFTLPPAGERKQWLYRMRPDNTKGGEEYTAADMRNDLLRDGTHPDYIHNIMGTLYRVPQVRQLQQLVDSGKANRDKVHDALLSEGFDKDWANTLADMEMVLSARRRQAEIHGYTPDTLAYLVARGEMSEADVKSLMAELGFTGKQAQRLIDVAYARNRAEEHRKYAVKAGEEIAAQTKRGYLMGVLHPDTVIANMTKIGMLKDAAVATMLGWDMQHQLDMRQQVIDSIKKKFVNGEISKTQALELLVSAGMTPLYATTMFGNWSANADPFEQLQKGERVLSMVQRGLLSPEGAMVTLNNLGWEVNTAEMKMAEITNKLKEQAIRLVQSQQASSARASKQAETLAMMGGQAIQTAREVMAKTTPVSSLKKWAKLGLISADKFTKRLEAMGYDRGIIDIWYAESCSGQKAACVDTDGPKDNDIPSGEGSGFTNGSGPPPSK